MFRRVGGFKVLVTGWGYRCVFGSRGSRCVEVLVVRSFLSGIFEERWSWFLLVLSLVGTVVFLRGGGLVVI